MSEERPRRSRRSAPARQAPAGRGSNTRLIFLIAALAVAGVAVIAVVVALAAGGGSDSSDSSLAAAQDVERSAAPELPGTHVNIPEIYGGSYPDDGGHVREAVDFAAAGNTNPPAGGPHWGSTSCQDTPGGSPPFCGPVRNGVYREPWPPASLIHNMEHGGVVIWYNTADQSIILELETLAIERLTAEQSLVLAPYAEIEAETIAITAWARIDKFPTGEYSAERVAAFIDAHLCRFNPEDQCQR